MALYRFSAGVIARSAGHSSTAAAAYRAGERLTDERTGQTHDYSRRTGVLWTGIYAPKSAPEWVQDRSQLWNAAEQAEKRKDAQTAREFIVCLPHELDAEQGKRLVGDFLRENFARKGFVADAAIHAPGKGGDERNTHAHFLVTMRQVDGRGFAATKDRTQNEKATLLGWRAAWAKLGNRHLERAGHAGTLDHRSYEDQGIQRAGGQHIGKAAKNMERRGIPTDAAEQREAFEVRAKEIAEIKAELARLEALPDRPAEVPREPSKPANDIGRPEGRAANENAAERSPEAAPPILKAEPPAGPDPARPIELAPVPERPAVPPSSLASTVEQVMTAPATPAAVAEATIKAEERPARVEASPKTSDAAEPTPGPATAEPSPLVRQDKPIPPKSKVASRQQRTKLQRLFTAAAEWALGLFAKTKPAPDRVVSEPTRTALPAAGRAEPLVVRTVPTSPAIESRLTDQPDAEVARPFVTEAPLRQTVPAPAKCMADLYRERAAQRAGLLSAEPKKAGLPDAEQNRTSPDPANGREGPQAELERLRRRRRERELDGPDR